MRQFVVDRPGEPGGSFHLRGDDFHYLVHVRRIAVGDQVTVVDDRGRQAHAVVSGIETDSLLLRVADLIDRQRLNAPAIVLYQAIPKGRRFDDIVRQAVQAGVARIVPLVTERTIVQPDDSGGNRLKRWARVAREAAQQSGAVPARIESPTRLHQIVPDEAVTLFLHTAAIEHSTLHGYLVGVPSTIGVVVGPEGGFSDGEVAWMQGHGFHPVWLGERVLRSESAGFYAVAAIQTVVLEHHHWRLVSTQNRHIE